MSNPKPGTGQDGIDEETMQAAKEMMAEQEREQKKRKEKEKNEEQGQDEPQPNQGAAQPAGIDTQIYRPPEVDVDGIPDEKKKEWVQQLLFDDEVREEISIAGGHATIEVAIQTGQQSLDLSKELQDLSNENPEASVQFVNTLMSIKQASYVLRSVNGENVGETPKQREEWLLDKGGILINEILETYNELEAKIATVLKEEDIKNS